MVVLRVPLIATIFLLSNSVSGLKVAPGSPCVALCSNSQDPNHSVTTEDEIACQDSSLNSTAVGQRFKSCVQCLQNSTFTAGGGDDQKWFLYNMRFALSTCLFGFRNNSDTVSTPCSTSPACGPLRAAVGNADLIPENEDTYSFCTADEHAMVGGSEFRCTQCLKASPQKYLGNFVAALKGSCSQQPPLGTMIGLSSSVFTSDEITPTFPGDNPNTRSSNDKKGLSRNAIIGISIGVCGLLLIILAILYWLARRQRFKHMKGLNSGFDERFGAPNITSPNSGAYGNPYASPAVHSAPLQFVPGGHSRKASHDQDYVERKGDWQGHNLPFQRQIGSLPQTQMPTHQAYIPKSPAESHSTQFSMSPIQSAKNSPEYPSHLTSPTSATTANTSTTARTSPFTTPTVRAAPRYPPRTQQRNQGLGNTITSPIENETATNRAAYERSDFQRAEQERRERERRGEVIRPLEKFRKDHGRKKQWSPDTVEDEDSLW